MAADAEISAVVQIVADIEDAVNKFGTQLPAAIQSGMDKGQAAVQDGTAKFQSHLEEASEGAKKAGEETGKSFGEAFSIIAAAIAVGFLEKLRESFSEALDYANELKGLSTITGDSTEELEKFSYALASVGVSSEGSRQALTIFQRNIASAAAANNGKSYFDQLGLNPKDIAAGTVTEAFDKVSDKVKNLAQTSQQASIATKLFGRGGADLLPALTQGSTGIDKLKNSSEAAAASVDVFTQKTLEAFHNKLAQLALISSTFYAEFVAPIVAAITPIVNAMEKMYAEFDKLSHEMKLDVIISAIVTALLLAEHGLQSLTGVIQGAISQEVIEGFLSFAGIINTVALAAATLWFAFQSNFANIRGAAEPFIAAIKAQFNEIAVAVQAVKDVINNDLKPAFDKVSDALSGPLQQLADFGTGLINFIDPVNRVKDALILALKAASAFTNWLGDHKIVVEAFAAAMLGLAGGQGIMAAVKAFEALRLAMIATNTWAALSLLVEAFAAGLKGGLVNAIRAVIVGLVDLSAAEALATAGISLVIAAIVLMIFNWRKSGEVILEWSRNALRALADFELACASAGEALANFVSRIPVVGNAIAGVIRTQVDEAKNWAKELNGSADALERTRQALIKGGQERKAPPDAKDDKKDEHTPPGTASLAKPPGKAGPDGTSEVIKRLEEQLVPFQEAVKAADAEITRLGKEMTALGTINTPEKLAAATRIYNLQQKASVTDQKAIAAEIAKTAEVEAKLIALRGSVKKGKTESKDQDAYDAAIKKNRESIDALKIKENDLHFMRMQNTQKERDAQIATYQAEIDNGATGTERRASLEAQVLAIMIKQGDTQKDINAYKLKTLQTAQQISEAELKNAAATHAGKEADLTARIGERNQDASTGGKKSAALVAVENTADELSIAQLKLLDSVNDLKVPTDAVTQAQTVYGKGSLEAISAQAALTQAETAHRVAEDAVTIATKKHQAALDATTPAVQSVRDGLLGMANTVAGPLVKAFQDMQAGMNPIVALFLNLFQQSKSFNDIMLVMKEIMAALARVFDALRPVVDFLLGILIGVVNVFIFLYNIVASVISLFGIHIEKIKALNANLDALNPKVPLLQITHDLPTMNEYNQGKWADLKAAQSTQTDSMTAGFNSNLAKLGEIFGVLVAMKAIMNMIGGKGLFGGASGSDGIMGMLKGLISGHSGGGATAGNPDGSGTSIINADGTGSDMNTGPINPGAQSPIDTGSTAIGTPDLSALDASNVKLGNIQVDATNATQNLTPEVTALSSNVSTLNTSVTDLASSTSSSGSSVGSLVNSLAGGSASGGSSSLSGKMGKLGEYVAVAGDAFAAFSTIFSSKPGQTAAQIRSGDASVGGDIGSAGGTIVGTALGGPLGGAIGGTLGKLLGSLVGGLFGPKNAGSQPDLTDPQFGNEEVGLTGKAFGTQGYGQGKMGTDVSSITGGTGLLQYIEAAIASGKSGLSAAQQAEFGKSGGGALTYGKNIENESVVGGNFSGNYKQLWADAMAAAQQISGTLGDSANMLANAGNMNLAAQFGNGSVSAMYGGLQLTPGQGASGASGVPTTQTSTPHYTVHVENLHGTDAATLKSNIKPLFDSMMADHGRKQQATTRNSSTQANREGYA